MSSTRIANRYAKALYRFVGKDSNKAREYLEQLSAVQALFGIEPAAKVLLSPVMPVDLKKKLFEAALEASGGPTELKAFIHALVGAGRVAIYPEFVAAFSNLINAATGVVSAEVVTAVKVDPEIVAQLTKSLEKLLGSKIQADQQVDPDLLGGFVVRLGNRMIDLSVKTKLDALAKSAAR